MSILYVDKYVKKSGNVGVMLKNTMQIYFPIFIQQIIQIVNIANPQKLMSMLRKIEIVFRIY